jgi:adenine-specific DNA-methyltransferase
MTRTRQQLLENFDETVHEKLRVNLRNSQDYLNRYEQMLISLTQHELGDHAEFVDGSAFTLTSSPYGSEAEIPLGRYELPRRTGEAHYYRLGHPLAVHVLETAKGRELPFAEVVFDYTGHTAQISVLDSLVGKRGSLVASLLTVESLGQAEDYLLVTAATDEGTLLEEEQASRLLTVSGRVVDQQSSVAESGVLDYAIEARKNGILRQVSERNAAFFEAEANKIDGWADDLKVGLEREIKEFDRQIKESRRAAVAALALEEKLEMQKQIRSFEGHRNTKRRALFEAQDEIDSKREVLITEIEGKLQRKELIFQLFSIQWSVL